MKKDVYNNFSFETKYFLCSIVPVFAVAAKQVTSKTLLKTLNTVKPN